MCSISIYERLRPLIVWLGLTELAWIGYWLLKPGDATPWFKEAAARQSIPAVIVVESWPLCALFGKRFSFHVSQGEQA